MELVDLYDENRVPLEKTAERYGKKKPGEYRMVVHVCLFGTDGRLLIQRRTEIFSPPPVPADVELLRRSYPVRLPKEAGEKSFSIEETLEHGGAPVQEILS